MKGSHVTQLKHHLRVHLDLIQIYNLNVIKPSFSHLSIVKLFCNEKRSFYLTELPSCIFSQNLWLSFYGFSRNEFNSVS